MSAAIFSDGLSAPITQGMAFSPLRLIPSAHAPYFALLSYAGQVTKPPPLKGVGNMGLLLPV